MARIFITGSTDGSGRAAAEALLGAGNEVVVHARNPERLAAVRELAERGAATVVGDLSEMEEIRRVAGQVNRIGQVDAVIHDAGVFRDRRVLTVNIVAPCLLTVLIERPPRFVYLSTFSVVQSRGSSSARCAYVRDRVRAPARADGGRSDPASPRVGS